MKSLAVLICLATLGAAAPALAAEPMKPTSQQLASLCNGCRYVTNTATEKHKGKASGVGAVGGAVAGGVVGNKVGDSTAATVGGAVVGGLLGHQIEKQVKKHNVWVVTTVGKDGASQRHELDADPQLRSGDVVVLDGQSLKRR